MCTYRGHSPHSPRIDGAVFDLQLAPVVRNPPAGTLWCLDLGASTAHAASQSSASGPGGGSSLSLQEQWLHEVVAADLQRTREALCRLAPMATCVVETCDVGGSAAVAPLTGSPTGIVIGPPR
jgi:hypothetical protein